MSKINWKEVQMFPLSAHVLNGAEAIKTYCMSGNAIVTLTSPSGVHYTYYIRAPWQDDKESFNEDIRFVYCLGNEGRWVYLGGLYKNGTLFRSTYNSRISETSESFKGMKYLVKMMNRDFDTPMVVQHEGSCGRCGRRLTDPVSIERGIGPKCINFVYHGA